VKIVILTESLSGGSLAMVKASAALHVWCPICIREEAIDNEE
jgi:hypothetical protein